MAKKAMEQQHVKRGPGRPRGSAKVASSGAGPNRSVRFPEELWMDIDEWQRRRSGEPLLTRAAAVRWLLDFALQVQGIRKVSDETAVVIAGLRKRKRDE